MRTPALLLAVLAACTAAPARPDFAPGRTGANAAALTGRRLAAPDPARTARFYAALLGGRVGPADGGAVVVTLDDDGAAWTFVPGPAPADAPPLALEVLDLDTALAELAMRGTDFRIETDPDGSPVVRLLDPDGRALEVRGRGTPRTVS